MLGVLLLQRRTQSPEDFRIRLVESTELKAAKMGKTTLEAQLRL
jgi:hypothetical protein